jgi:signal transduction histidine kinase
MLRPPIVRSIVAEQPGAEITVESTPGHGTTFILTVPVANGVAPTAELPGSLHR